ncbi:MAG TPA: hypothetical protein VH206_08700 [Xanthobacteraceae bacterium]|nr:hypothetical protein [Xanthobacteraceae bacterium]
MRVRLWAAALGFAFAWQASAHAEWSATLPAFKACTPATPPEMPERWHAVGLMLPLHDGQIDVGEFDYDGPAQAMRATVYGLESGTADILITDQDTYLLSGPHQAPTRCVSLGAKMRLPSAQWLTAQSQCAGETPIAGMPVQWWQKPGFDSARYWFRTGTRLPWRTLFLKRTLDPAIIGDYAMTYFPAFTPVLETHLAALKALCTGAPRSTKELSETPTARELMMIGNKTGEAERETRVAELVPGLSHKACARKTPSQWPDRYVMTAVVTPIALEDAPYPTLIYYDWNEAQTQLVLPFHGYPPALEGLLSLKKQVGYRLKFSHSAAKPGVCHSDLPGIVKPDWMKAASCSCKGVISANAALGVDAETQILSCPIRNQKPRIMWSWYTSKGKPILFMEAEPSSGGVMLADYDAWIPGETGRASDFELPNACAPVADPRAAPSGGAPNFSSVSCSDCHTTR